MGWVAARALNSRAISASLNLCSATKAVQNIKAADAGASYASADGVLTAMFPNFLVASVLKNNVYADALGFVFNTSVEQFFKSMRDQVGGFIFAEEMNKQRTLAG